jgi:hypothetical protein
VNVPSEWSTIRLAEGARDNLFLFNGTEVLIGLIYDGAACCLFDGGTVELTLMARLRAEDGGLAKRHRGVSGPSSDVG